MKTKVAVIGGGPGGYVAALNAARLDADVTLVEKESLGGVCLNRGCIPSKIMKTAAELFERIKHAEDFGINVTAGASINLAKLGARQQRVVSTQIRGIQGLLDGAGVSSISGKALITGPGKMDVEKADGSRETLLWDKLIIASGSRARSLPGMDFDGVRIISSNEALNLKEVPTSVIIAGGGAIGCEFACMLSAFGSKVTVVEAMERLLPLPSVDSDCSKVLLREMKKRKIRVMLGAIIEKVDFSGEGIFATPAPFTEGMKGKTVEPAGIEGDLMLICTGRAADTADLGLENIGVETDEKGWIKADERMETSVSGVYAIGDVLGPSKPMLAHAASAEGDVAARNAMGDRCNMNYDVIPGAIFTMPEVANVGLTEAEAEKRGAAFRADTVMFRTMGKAHVIGEIAGEAKIVSELNTGRVLGVHIIGPGASDLIAEGALAVQTERTVRDICETVHAHPTLAEIMHEVSLKAAGMALHAL